MVGSSFVKIEAATMFYTKFMLLKLLVLVVVYINLKLDTFGTEVSGLVRVHCMCMSKKLFIDDHPKNKKIHVKNVPTMLLFIDPGYVENKRIVT